MAKLKHIAISVPDPHKAAEFYERSLGMRRVRETDYENATGVYVTDGVISIALLRYKNDAATADPRGKDYFGVHHFGFVVDDVDESRRKIETHGGRHVAGEKSPDGGFFEVKCRDPDGNLFDINDTGWPTGA